MAEQGNNNKNIERQAANTLLSKGLKFGVPVFGREHKFTIKPLYLGTVIKMSKYSAALKFLDADEPISGTLKASGNLIALSKVVACGVLNSRFWNGFSGVFAWWLRYKLTAKELNTIATLVVRQMSVEDFFFTTQLIGGVNLLMTTANKEAEKQSGEVSQESPKHSDTHTEKSSGAQAGQTIN
jgi:hypothetical protein